VGPRKGGEQQLLSKSFGQETGTVWGKTRESQKRGMKFGQILLGHPRIAFGQEGDAFHAGKGNVWRVRSMNNQVRTTIGPSLSVAFKNNTKGESLICV